jgi:hypothetical protein
MVIGPPESIDKVFPQKYRGAERERSKGTLKIA